MGAEDFGNKVTAARRELGLTQAELACLLGVTRKAVSRWECGRGYPDVEMLVPLSRAIKLPVSELLGQDEGSEPNDAEHSVRPMIVTGIRRMRTRAWITIMASCVYLLMRRYIFWPYEMKTFRMPFSMLAIYLAIPLALMSLAMLMYPQIRSITETPDKPDDASSEKGALVTRLVAVLSVVLILAPGIELILRMLPLHYDRVMVAMIAQRLEWCGAALLGILRARKELDSAYGDLH